MGEKDDSILLRGNTEKVLMIDCGKHANCLLYIYNHISIIMIMECFVIKHGKCVTSTSSAKSMLLQIHSPFNVITNI